MAKNGKPGDGHRVGAVNGRTQVQNPVTGLYTKREPVERPKDTITGLIASPGLESVQRKPDGRCPADHDRRIHRDLPAWYDASMATDDVGAVGVGRVTGMDLFAGAGGLTLGLKAAGVETVVAVEIEPDRVATYRAHTPNADILCDDIRSISFESYRRQVTLVYGGPPCQPFSSGGLRRSESDGRNMVPEFVRVVREVEPAAFLMENVPGLATGPRAAYLERVLHELQGLGFFVSWRILSAADYGVPQKRRRLFVVGLRHRLFSFPPPTHGPRCGMPYVSVRDVLPNGPIGEPNPSRVFYAKNPDTRPSPYDGHLFNGGGRPIDPAEPCSTILASAGGNKTHFFDDLNLVPAYHRHLLAGGMPHQGALPGARRLTVDESAVIQTFPVGTRFSGSRSAQYAQVGDAVPPLLAQAVGRAVVDQLELPAAPAEHSHAVQGSLFD